MTDRPRTQLSDAGRLHLARRPLPRADQPAATCRSSSTTSTSSASPPTRRSSPAALAKGDAYDAQVRDLAAGRHGRRRGGRSRSRPTTSATPATSCAASTTRPAAWTAASRSRSTRGWRTTPHATVEQAKALWAAVDRPNVLIKIPATVEGLPAITAGARRGHQRQRHADLLASTATAAVMDAYLTGLEQATAGRQRPVRRSTRSPRSSSPASTPRSTSASTRSAPTRPRRCKGKAGVANARLAYQAYEEVFATPRWQALRGRGRPHAAPALGLHRRQGPGLPRHDLRHRARRARHRQHDAGEDARGDRRPRRDRRRHRHRQLRRRQRRARRARARSASPTTTSSHVLERRGRRQVREVLGRAARRRPGRAREGARRVDVGGSDARRLGVVAAAGGRRDRAARAGRWSPTGSPAGSSPRTPRCGARTPRPSRPCGSAGSACPASSRPLVGEIAALRERAARRTGVDRVVLCGMGGSSLAPEVICAHRRGATLDRPRLHRPRPRARAPWPTGSTAPSSSSRSKSGGTVETDSQRRAFEAGVHATPASTRPRASSSSPTRARPLDEQARDAGYRGRQRRPERRRPLLRADRVRPGARAGWPASTSPALLDEAEAVADLLADDDEANPGLRARRRDRPAPTPLRDKLVLVDDGSGIVGFADWAEQLIAESHRQERHGRPAGRRRRRRRPRGRAGPPPTSIVAASSATPTSDPDAGRRRRAAEVRRRQRPARRADAALGVRDRGRRPAARASTRSTSPTSRAPRSPPAGCSTARPAPAPPGLRRRRRRGARPRRRCSAAPTPSPARSTRCSAQLDADARLPRGDGLPRPARDAALADVPRGRWPAAPAGRRPSAGARGSCTRPASTTRAARRPGVFLQITGDAARGPRRSPTGRSPSASFIAAQAAGDAQVLADHGRPVLRLHLHRPRRPGSPQLRRRARPQGARMSPARVARGTTRCATRATGGCPGSPGRAAWSSSASPATWPARS